MQRAGTNWNPWAEAGRSSTARTRPATLAEPSSCGVTLVRLTPAATCTQFGEPTQAFGTDTAPTRGEIGSRLVAQPAGDEDVPTHGRTAVYVAGQALVPTIAAKREVGPSHVSLRWDTGCRRPP